MPPPQIHFIEPHSADLEALRNRLSLHGYRCVVHGSLEDCLAALDRETAACVIAPVQVLPIENGKPQGAFGQLASTAAIVVVADRITVDQAVVLMEAGAITVQQHPLELDRLLPLIERELRLRQERSESAARRSEAARVWATLSEDERQIVKLLLSGKTTKAMAGQLHLSTRTIDRRRRSVLQKMNVSTISELALLLGSLENLD